ncbi:MAG: dTDP-4-dehydrorhamnose reductase [Rhodospirillaceae bacterium]
MAQILLTAQNGQLGWEIARRAQRLGLTVAGGDRRTLDITDNAAVVRAVRDAAPRVVINAAAYTAVDKAETDQDAALDVNRDGAAHLAAACAAAGIPMIHLSTDYVFDGRKPTPYVETDPVGPLGIYGASKLAGEEAVRAATPCHVILRTSWVYGPHGSNFVKTMLRLGQDHHTLRVVDDQRGSPTMAGDLADAVLTLAQKAIDGELRGEGFGTFHCSNSGTTTWHGFAQAIFKLAAPHMSAAPVVIPVTSAEFRTVAQRPANSVLACDKLHDMHGIRMRPWQDGLADMLGEVFPLPALKN